MARSDTSRRTLPRQRYRAPNVDAFRCPSPSRDYWLGFLMADGCVAEREVILVLQSGDARHAEAFLGFAGCDDRALHGANAGRGVRASICSAALAREMRSHGIVPGRTAPVPDELLQSRDFWRGVVDGDGTLRIARRDGMPSISVVGREPLMSEFAAYVASVLPDSYRPRLQAHQQTDAVVVVGLGGRRARFVVRHLYAGAETALPRKRARAERISAWEPAVRSRYPWESWGDGRRWCLSRGTDYDDPTRLWEAARRAARARGCWLRFDSLCSHALVQFVKR